ncbi:uncharacterized protein [Littorina saxatilis]|uniref:Uncharacterized protein n=1 Tax=Littorina saxatilis TaxID=31220 RepID=A0AAN9BGB9_9CAEN
MPDSSSSQDVELLCCHGDNDEGWEGNLRYLTRMNIKDSGIYGRVTGQPWVHNPAFTPTPAEILALAGLVVGRDVATQKDADNPPVGGNVNVATQKDAENPTVDGNVASEKESEHLPVDCKCKVAIVEDPGHLPVGGNVVTDAGPKTGLLTEGGKEGSTQSPVDGKVATQEDAKRSIVNSKASSLEDSTSRSAGDGNVARDKEAKKSLADSKTATLEDAPKSSGDIDTDKESQHPSNAGKVGTGKAAKRLFVDAKGRRDEECARSAGDSNAATLESLEQLSVGDSVHHEKRPAWQCGDGHFTPPPLDLGAVIVQGETWRALTVASDGRTHCKMLRLVRPPGGQQRAETGEEEETDERVMAVAVTRKAVILGTTRKGENVYNLAREKPGNVELCPLPVVRSLAEYLWAYGF